MGGGIVYRRPKMVYDDNETKSSRYGFEVTPSPTRTSARTCSSHKKLTSVIFRGVVVKVCAALDVDRRFRIRVDSTCEVPTDVSVSGLGRRLR